MGTGITSGNLMKRRVTVGWGLSLLWLLLLGALVLLWQVGQIGLIDETEPLFVEASRQMLLTGDWITPYFDGEPRFDKPPLIYWLMVLAFKIFGVNEFAARLPSVLSAIAVTVLCFYTLKQFAGRTKSEPGATTAAELEATAPPSNFWPWRQWLPAWLGATMLLLNPNTFFWGRTAYSDMLLTACIGGALLTFFCGYAQPTPGRTQQRWYWAFYVCIALAILTKGPIGVVLPGLAIAGFLVYVGQVRATLAEMQWRRGAVLVLALTLPWYLLVIRDNGWAFIDSFFGYHNVERFTSVVNRHAGPWYFHFLVILVGFLPWSVYLPAAIARLRPWRRREWQAAPRSEHLGLFALAWFVAVLGFFTVAVTKYFSYTLPLMPAAAILVALLWAEWIAEPSRRHAGFLWSGGFAVLLSAALAGALLYSPQWLGDDPWMPNLGARLQAAGLPLLGSWIWGATAITTLVFLLWRSRWLWLANLIGMLLFIGLVILPGVGIADIERQQPLREMAQILRQAAQPTDAVIMVGFKKPSLVFYTQRHVTYFGEPATVIPRLQQAFAASPQESTAWVVAANRPLQRTGLSADQYQSVHQSGVYRLVRVEEANFNVGKTN